MFYINRKKTKLLIVVSIETTSTDYILYAIEQRQNKSLDFSLYSTYSNFRIFTFLLLRKKRRKKKEGSSFELSIFKTCHFNTTVASRTLTVYDHFIYFFFFHIHQWNTNLRSATSFNRFVKRIPLSPHKRKGFVAYFNLYA